MEKDIGKIAKNDQTDIVIRVDDFGGKTGLTIREFVSSDRYTGFTKAGVRISAADFGRFKEMINSISDADMATGESQVGSGNSGVGGGSSTVDSRTATNEVESGDSGVERRESEVGDSSAEESNSEELPDY